MGEGGKCIYLRRHRASGSDEKLHAGGINLTTDHRVQEASRGIFPVTRRLFIMVSFCFYSENALMCGVDFRVIYNPEPLSLRILQYVTLVSVCILDA